MMFSSEIRAVFTRPEVRKEALTCLVIRLLYIPTVILALPYVVWMFIGLIFVSIGEGLTKRGHLLGVFCWPAQRVTAMLEAQYDKALASYAGVILKKEEQDAA